MYNYCIVVHIIGDLKYSPVSASHSFQINTTLYVFCLQLKLYLLKVLVSSQCIPCVKPLPCVIVLHFVRT